MQSQWLKKLKKSHFKYKPNRPFFVIPQKSLLGFTGIKIKMRLFD